MAVQTNGAGMKHGSKSFSRKIWCAAAVVALGAAATGASAQSGTYLARSSGNWNDSGLWLSGTVANGGGIATLADASDSWTLTIPGGYPLTLTTVVYSSAFSLGVTGTSTGVLNAGISGIRFDILKSETATPSYLSAGLRFDAQILSAGPLHKTGPGSLTLIGNATRTNEFTGGINVLGGQLWVNGGGNGALGVSANTITLDNGGTLLVSGANLTSGAGRNVVVGSGGGTVGTLSAGTTISLSGSLNGTGNLTKTFSGLYSQTQGGTLSGNVIIRGGTFALEQRSGAMTNVTTWDLGTTLLHDSSRANVTSTSTGAIIVNHNNNNRIGDTATVVSRGGELIVRGNMTNDTSELAGTYQAAEGWSQITLQPNTNTATTLTFTNLARSNDGAVIIRGSALGGVPGPGVANVVITNAIPVVGGGGAAGTTTMSILPWGLGSNITSPLNNAVPSDVSFLTRDAGTGRVRGLTAAEYSGSLAGVTTNNVAVTGNLAVAGPTTVNALKYGGGTLSGLSTLTVTSGAVLVSSPATISAPLDFGSAQGVLLTQGATTVSGPISGSGGLVKTLPGTLILTGSAANSSYSGQTTLAGGITRFEGNLPVGANSAFGNTSAPIVLTAGRDSGIPEIPLDTRLWAETDTVISRDITVAGNGVGTVRFGSSDGIQTVTMNGTLTLQRQLNLEFGQADPNVLGAVAVFNGTITGPGSLTDHAGNYSSQRLNASNNYSGGTWLRSGVWELGNDSALGSGPVIAESFSPDATTTYVGSLSAVPGTGPRTLANAFRIADGISFSGDENFIVTGPVDLTGFTPAVSVDNATTTFAGSVRDGAIFKQGLGTLVLSGAGNSVLGESTVFAGTLDVGAGGTTGDLQGDVVLGDGGPFTDAALRFNRSNTVVYAGRISGPGTVWQVGTGTTVLTSNNLYRFTNITNGRLEVGNNGTTGTVGGLTITVDAPGTIAFKRSDNQFLINEIMGTGSVENAGSGSVDLLAPLTYEGDTRVTGGGTLRIYQELNTPNGNAVVSNGNLRIEAPHNSAGNTPLRSATFASVSVGANSTLVLPAVDRSSEAANVLVTSGLTIASSLGTSTGLLDLGNNDMVVLGGTSNLAAIRQAVRSWLLTGNKGLGATQANPGATGRDAFATLGARSNDSGFGFPELTSFDGVSVGATDVLVKYTYRGDTNLDGVLDARDFNAVLSGFSNALSGPSATWQNGDVNYDGVVNVTDWNLFLNAYTYYLSNPVPFDNGTSGGAAIPEPAALGLLAGALPLLSRRKRR